MRLPQGLVARGVTPVQALALGLSVDAEAFTNATNLDAATKSAVLAELQTDLSPANAPILNGRATTVALVEANAVIGIVTKDTNGDGTLSIAGGDKVGVSCAVCHAVTDGSVLAAPAKEGGGGIGLRRDGVTPHNLDVGTIFAAADNSRAYYPLLQLALAANGGATIGLAEDGLTETSTEAEVDAYLDSDDTYPRGSFDDVPEGNAVPMHIASFFETDLAAPWGTDGSIARVDNVNNIVYTLLLDPTNLTTDGGRAFLRSRGGKDVDQSRFVPGAVVPIATLQPDYTPMVLAERPVELPFRPVAQSPIQNDPETFDDKLVVMDASIRGADRGYVVPLLLDLASKPNFLHESKVSSLESLLSSSRGANAPHPFFVDDGSDRAALIAFLEAQSTAPSQSGP